MKKYFKATFKIENYSLTPWIENGVITNRLPDMDGETYGTVDDGNELPSVQAIHNLTSQKIVDGSVVIAELTEAEYIAAGHMV